MIGVEEGGGESACFAHLICPECGTVLDDTAHRKDCSWMNSESRIELTPTMIRSSGTEGGNKDFLGSDDQIPLRLT